MNQLHAIKLAAVIEEHMEPIGYHVALTGGCLYKHGDRKDADFILYPHNPAKQLDRDDLKQALGRAGFVNFFDTNPEYTNRRITLASFAGKRCDFFILT